MLPLGCPRWKHRSTAGAQRRIEPDLQWNTKATGPSFKQQIISTNRMTLRKNNEAEFRLFPLLGLQGSKPSASPAIGSPGRGIHMKRGWHC